MHFGCFLLQIRTQELFQSPAQSLIAPFSPSTPLPDWTHGTYCNIKINWPPINYHRLRGLVSTESAWLWGRREGRSDCRRNKKIAEGTGWKAEGQHERENKKQQSNNEVLGCSENSDGRRGEKTSARDGLFCVRNTDRSQENRSGQRSEYGENLP